jgi:quinol monooxygenase YgiN
MIMSLLKITPQPDKQREVMGLLDFIIARTRINPQCLSSSIYREDSDKTILYLEKWQGMEDFCLHIKSSSYMSILAAMELSTSPPEMSVSESVEPDGMELIKKLRLG